MSIIPSINLHVSIDTFYNFQKFHTNGFNWSFDLHHTELNEPQHDLLDFLSVQCDKGALGRIEIKMTCLKIGNTLSNTFGIDTIKKIDGGWRIEDHY